MSSYKQQQEEERALQLKMHYDAIEGYVQRISNRISVVYPKGLELTEEKFRSDAISFVREDKSNAKVLERSTPESVAKCILFAAKLGLTLDKNVGHFYVVPFKGTLTPVIGYKGYLSLIHRSSPTTSIYSQMVHEGDKCYMDLGTAKTVVHEAGFNTHTNPIGVYAIVTLPNGNREIERMSIVDVNKIRNGRGGPWKTHYEAMARKTVLRRMVKYLPVNSLARMAADAEECIDAGVKTIDDYIDGELDTPVQSQTQGQKLMDEINARSKADQAAEVRTHIHSDRVENVRGNQAGDQVEVPEVSTGN